MEKTEDDILAHKEAKQLGVQSQPTADRGMGEYRKLFYEKTWVRMIGLWFIFVPMFLVGILFLVLSIQERSLNGIIECLILICLGVLGIVKSIYKK
jgi:hypothetical protein